MSCQPCGCDPQWKGNEGTTGWVCELHRAIHYNPSEQHPPDPYPQVSGSGRLGALKAQELTRPTNPITLPPHPVLSAQDRKERPIARGVLDYFPDALLEVAHVSYVGNEQHNPGQPLHWAKEKSTDQADCIIRHLIDRGTFDSDGMRHSAKVAWRALALLQTEIDADKGRKA